MVSYQNFKPRWIKNTKIVSVRTTYSVKFWYEESEITRFPNRLLEQFYV